MEKKNKSRLLMFVVAIILLIVFVICCIGSSILLIGWASSISSITTGEVLEDGARDQGIAVIDVSGVITTLPASGGFFGGALEDMVTSTINKLETAKNDSNIKAVILRVDSPGGEVYGSQLIYNKVKEVEKEKPVIALMLSQAASGGYYVSAPATKIVAADSTITGSIGVIFSITDVEGLYEKLGIRTIAVTNSEGDFKSLTGSKLADKNSDEYKILESIADDTYNQFVQVIVEGRGMTREAVVAVANGSIYSGVKAKELGLVDELGYMEKAIEIASEEAGLSDPKVFVVAQNQGYFGNMDAKLGAIIRPIERLSKPEGELGGIEAMYILPF